MVSRAGVFIPLALAFSFLVILLDAMVSPLTWERPAVYGVTLLSLLVGIYALVRTVRVSGRRWPSLFVLTLLYEKLALVPVMAVLVLSSLEDLVGASVPEAVGFPLLVSSLLAIFISNAVLWFGYQRGGLDAETDPTVLRFLFARRSQ